jgi:hypothetical protein
MWLSIKRLLVPKKLSKRVNNKNQPGTVTYPIFNPANGKVDDVVLYILKSFLPDWNHP